jgi:hypothetical protein
MCKYNMIKSRFGHVFPSRQDCWDTKPIFPTHTMKAFKEIGDIAPVTLNLDTRRR